MIKLDQKKNNKSEYISNIIPNSDSFSKFITNLGINKDEIFLCEEISVICLCIDFCIYIQISHKIYNCFDTFNEKLYDEKKIFDYADKLYKNAKINNDTSTFGYFEFTKKK